MKIKKNHIEYIRAAFKQMQSKEDFVKLLNYTKTLIFDDKAIPFRIQQINYYINTTLSDKHYKEFSIKKKSGAKRSIHAPTKGLKVIQKVLSAILQCVFEPHHAAMGFTWDKSIVDNAKIHAGSRYVYNIDLKDFFPSIDQARVWKCLQLKPFELNRPPDQINIHDALINLSNAMIYTKFNPSVLGLNKDSNNVNERILKVTVPGLHLINGWRKVLLNSGETITYKIEKNISGTTSELSIYLDRSSYNSVAEHILKNYPDKKDNESYLFLILIELVLNHQNKLFQKNNRGVIANIIAAICCTEMEVERLNELNVWTKVKKNVLPQGAPTSPIITNIVCQRLDYLLSGVAKRFGLKYSRYADDITFSSMHNVYQAESEFIKELYRIIAEQKFHIKESKTRLQKIGYRQEVTGLLVNNKVNVQKRYVKQLRMWLYYWERYGYERAYDFFLQKYLSEKGHVKKEKPDMANVIKGKLNYLKMVKGEGSEMCLALQKRFEKLTESKKQKKNREGQLNQILDLIFTSGLDEAMKHYK
jgi:hypothetical protein